MTPKTLEPTYTATIYVGRKVRSTGEVLPLATAQQVCHDYVDEVGLCVTFTPTEYIYTRGKNEGGEPGIIVGLINYPRFPSTPVEIKEHAEELARRLMLEMKQLRVTIVFPKTTIMLTNEDLLNKEDPQQKESDSYADVFQVRCEKTGHIVGTDTVMIDGEGRMHICECRVCQADAVLRERGLSLEDLHHLLQEGAEVREEMHKKYAHVRRLTGDDLKMVLQQLPLQ